MRTSRRSFCNVALTCRVPAITVVERHPRPAGAAVAATAATAAATALAGVWAAATVAASL